MNHSRRSFLKNSAAAAPLFWSLRHARGQATASGVRIGAITYSFHDMPNEVGKDHLDAVIADSKACDLHLLELMAAHLEPYAAPAKPGTPEAQKNREALRAWRLATPASHFAEAKKKLNDAGITVFAYTVNALGNNFTPEEMDKVFEQAQTLGAKTISTSTTLTAAETTIPFCEKHRFPVAYHNHQDIHDPNQFSTPETFAKAMKMSPWFRINLDIGYITGVNENAVEYIRANHERITHLHIKDRQKNLGDTVAWGTGDTPIKPVLQLLKQEHYDIPALVELSYKIPEDSNCVKEVAKCLDYMRRALA